MAASAALTAYLQLTPPLPRDVRLKEPLRVYARDGELIAEFGQEKRIPVALKQVPQRLRAAVLAAEDDRFYQHPGIDYLGLLRAALHLLKTGEKSQGGSTITMQVARNFFLTSERTYLRKLKEVLLALKLERQLSKDAILELYLNQMYLGNRAYGVAAAAQVYFGKTLDQLTLAEIAMIAGLPKAPSRDNPIADPERAATRRAYVLGRMRALGQVTAADYDRAMSEAFSVGPSDPLVVEAPYLAEMVRAYMVKRYGQAAYTEGYRVFTSIDASLQRAADTALRRTLLDYDARHGYRGPVGRLPAAPKERSRVLKNIPALGGLLPAQVVRVEAQEATLYVQGRGEAHLPWAGVSWAKPHIDTNRLGPAPKQAADILAAGDIVYVRLEPGGHWHLAQIPAVGGALVALSPSDGAIRALSGGFDFLLSKFNRVTQAQRPVGSSLKPFIYSAALEKGFTPASLINDRPVVIDRSDQEAGWHPENYNKTFYGPTRLRDALAHSRNLVSIRLLRSIGMDYAISYMSRFGFRPEQLPRGLSLALGSAALTPLDLAAGYAVFANGGYRVTPYYIERILARGGDLLWQAPMACDDCSGPGRRERAISARNAYLMASMMADVVRRGTAQAALALGRHDLAGKTGSTNDWQDAWFSGFNSSLLATAWVGFDQPRTLGEGETGGHAALPMWMDFMSSALQSVPEQRLQPPTGTPPEYVASEAGLPTRPDAPAAGTKAFGQARASTAPPAARAAPEDEVWSTAEQMF